jgi:oxygen-independent coproporphyrinogen III oxidase
MSETRFDAELISRYDLNVPPYTSYPTPPHFHAAFNVLSYRRAALLSNAGSSTYAAAIRLPLCTSHPSMPQYLECVRREIELQSELFDPRRLLRQLYVSGDATSLGDTAALQQLLQHLDLHFRLAPPGERQFSIHIDPSTATASMVEQLAALGFGCANFSIPCHEAATKQERARSFEHLLRLTDVARSSGFDCLGFELSYGLPHQTHRELAKLLQAVVAAKPDRLTTYTYPHLPELQSVPGQLRSRSRPSAATRLSLRRLAIETLTRAGYVDIGRDCFAWRWEAGTHPRCHAWLDDSPGLADAECDLLGIGAGAVSRVGTAYAQNAKRVPDYCATLQQHVLPITCGVELTVDDVVRREVIQQIMCQRTLDFAAIASRYALDFHSYFARELTQLRALANDGLVIDSDTGFEVSARGHLLLQNITSVFDAYRHVGRTAPVSVT